MSKEGLKCACLYCAVGLWQQTSLMLSMFALQVTLRASGTLAWYFGAEDVKSQVLKDGTTQWHSQPW